jgi:hypothetical protein
MNNLERLARKYRLRAEELRATAAVASSEKRSKRLSQVARDYDLRACTADAIERTYRQLLSVN